MNDIFIKTPYLVEPILGRIGVDHHSPGGKPLSLSDIKITHQI